MAGNPQSSAAQNQNNGAQTQSTVDAVRSISSRLPMQEYWFHFEVCVSDEEALVITREATSAIGLAGGVVLRTDLEESNDFRFYCHIQPINLALPTFAGVEIYPLVEMTLRGGR